MSTEVANNPFRLFSPKNGRANNSLPLQDLLTLLGDFVEATHKYLLTQYSNDVITKTILLRPYHSAKKSKNDSRYESYLKNFIHTFEKNNDFQSIVQLYQNLLKFYGAIKAILHELNANISPSNTIETLVPLIIESFDKKDPFFSQWSKRFNALTQQPAEALHEEITERPILSKQEIALGRLQTTFMHCINNQATENSWYPERYENYYLAKLKILWHDYTEQYGAIDEGNLIATAIFSILSENQETVIAKHVEAQHVLEKQKGHYSQPNFQKKQDKLQQQREQQLSLIKSSELKLQAHANAITDLAKDTSSPTAACIFSGAIKEIKRKELSITSNPALFNHCTTKKLHTHINLDKIDNLQEMKIFGELFSNQCAKIATVEENIAPAA